MIILAALLIVCVVVFDKGEEKKREKSFYNEYFDTVVTVADYSGRSKRKFEENSAAVEKTLEYYHKLFDIYNDHSGVTGLYEINKNAGVAPVKVPSELIEFLEFSKEMYTLSGGEVNIAMGAVLSIWHDLREGAIADPENARIPTEEELSEAAKHCDIEKLIIDKKSSTVYLADKDMSLDVGAIGKGYAAERAAELLYERGAEGYVLNLGGNIRVIGEKPDGEGFKTGIKDPLLSEDYAKIVTIKDTSAVTSGGYERYFSVGDRRYHHIIDKDTLFPAEYFASVTVITEDSGLADALSTALFCMSYEEGAALVKGLAEVRVIWVYHDGRIIDSSEK